MKKIIEIEIDSSSLSGVVNQITDSLQDIDSNANKVSDSLNKISFNKPISDLDAMKQVMQQIAQADGIDLTDFNKAFADIGKKVPEIKSFLAELKKELNNVNDPQSLKALQANIDIVEAGLRELESSAQGAEKGVENLGNEATESGEKFKSLRAQIRENTVELQRLQDAGQDNTEEYRKLSAATSELIDAQGDLQGALRANASDTRKIDLGVEAITTAVGAYQTYIAVAELTGVKNEELEKSIQKLVAIQNIANGIQQIGTFLTTKGQLATALAAQAKNLYTFATTGATVATRAFSAALVATGIGAVVVGLGLLVTNWEKLTDAISDSTKAQETYNEVSQEANESASKEIASLKILTSTAQDDNLSKKQRLKAVDDLQKQYPNYFGNLSKEKILYGDISKEIESLNKALVEKARVQAIEGKIAEIAKKRLDAELKARNDEAIFRNTKQSESYINYITKVTREELEKTQAELKGEEDILLALLKQSNKGSESLTPQAERKKIENVYKERKKALDDALLKEQISTKEGLDKINAEYKQKLDERNEAILKDLKEGKLTKLQANDLRKSAALLTQTELKKATDDYLTQLTQERQRINDEITKLDQQYNKERIDLIQNNIEKETANSALIYKTEINALEEQKAKLLKEAEEKYKEDPETKARVKANIENVFYDLSLNAFERNELRKLDIAKKYFDEQLQLINDASKLIQSESDRAAAEAILKEANRYKKGEINYKTYQENVKKIQDDYNKKNLQSEIDQSQKLIDENDKRLAELEGQTSDAANKERTDLEAKQNELYASVARKKTQIIEESKKRNEKGFLAKLLGIDNEEAALVEKGLKDTLNASLSFLKEQARAEEEYYNQAISFQEQRVQEATKYAEQGNIEYLRLEEERLAELERKREEAAQRQLEIDTVLQASQMALAVAGAVAQIAKGGVGNVIAGIGVIATTLASGYALINQYQAKRPQFWEGAERVSDALGAPNRSGRDGYDISVDGSERIVPKSINDRLGNIKNKDLPYLVENGLILNDLIASGALSPKVKDMSSKEISELITLKKEMKELKEISVKQLQALNTLSVSANVDENGLYASISTIAKTVNNRYKA